MKILSLNELSLISGGSVQTQANSSSYPVLAEASPYLANDYTFKSIVNYTLLGGFAGSFFTVLTFRGNPAPFLFIPVGAAVAGTYATAKVLDRLTFAEEAV